jgi:O-antigen/teichoic acid export membrane protein
MISTYNVFLKTQIYNKYIITFVFSLVNAFFNFWFFRIALKELGEDSFYYYAYSRRIISFISPVLMMGIGVGLPRYMGVYYKYKRDVSVLLNAGLLIVSIASISWALINLTLNEYLTAILWGEVTEFTLLLNLSICLNLIAISIWGVIHSYFRGKLMVFITGILLLTSQSFIPFLGFYFMNSLNAVYNFISILLLGVSIIILIILFRKKRIVPKYKDVIKL